MQRTRIAILLMAVAALAATPLGGCRKEGSSSSPVAALLPAGTAAKLPKNLLVFAEELPADVDAFGYADGGQSLDQLTGQKDALGDYRQLYEDLAAMTQRRWGVDLRQLSGLGFIVHQGQPLLVAAVPSKAPEASGGEIADEIMLGKLGKLTVLGEPGAVTALLAAAKQGKRLHQTNPGWLRSALGRAAGNFAFATASVEKLVAGAPPAVKTQLGELTSGTVAIGGDGLVAAVVCKPGSVDKVRALVEGGLAMARQLIDQAGGQLPADPPGPLLGVLLRHYSGALFKSLEQKVSGDELVMTLGWHAPALPAAQPVSLAERVVAPGELAVVQLNLGAPILDLAIAVTDVLKAPLDRAALKKELAAELARAVGVEGLDPRAATLSVNSEGVIVSLHNAPVGAPLAPLSLLGGAIEAVATPWGLAVSPLPQQGGLVSAAAKPEPGLELGGVKLLAAGDAIFRGYVDVTRLPPPLLAELQEVLPQGFPSIRSVAMTSTSSRVSLEMVTASGKAKELVKSIAGLIDLALPMVDELYQNRAKASAVEELMAIVQHYQRTSLKRYLTPTSIDGDRLTFVTEVAPAQMQVMTGAAVVGVAAAVAIPAFMSYSRASRDLDDLNDLPVPHDPDMLESQDVPDPQGDPLDSPAPQAAPSK